MKPNFEQLDLIKKIEAPSALFEKIDRRLHHQKQIMMMPIWTKLAAAIFIVLFTTEIYLITTIEASNSNYLETMVPIQNNLLYD